MNKLIKIFWIFFLLSGCGDDPFADNSKIKDTDYARIRIEIERCSHIDSEGSFSVLIRWAPKTACLNHLKSRIVATGNKKNDVLLE